MKSNLKIPRGLLFAVFLVLAFSETTTAQRRTARTKPPENAVRPLTTRQIADKISKSLVVVFTQDIDGKPLAQGSGFFFGIPKKLYERKTGDSATDMRRLVERVNDYKTIKFPLDETKRSSLVVSNLHVFKRAWTGNVKLAGSPQTYNIKRVVGIDIKHDLCVFEVEGLTAPALMLADPEIVGMGDDILVGGNPVGLENTLSKGIISSIRKSEGYLQIDAPISSGSSGGPVVDTRGNVVGVATSSLISGQNLNFAVAGSYLLNLGYTWNTSVKETGAFSISDAENDGLVGKVRLMTVRLAEIDHPEKDVYSQQPRSHAMYLFNQEGNYLETTTFDEKGEFYSVFSTDYDVRGIRQNIRV